MKGLDISLCISIKMAQYSPHQIDDANLSYYYRALLLEDGVYYVLQREAPPAYPRAFWASERCVKYMGKKKLTKLLRSMIAQTPSWATKLVSTVRVVAHTMGPVIEGG